MERCNKTDDYALLERSCPIERGSVFLVFTFWLRFTVVSNRLNPSVKVSCDALVVDCPGHFPSFPSSPHPRHRSFLNRRLSCLELQTINTASPPRRHRSVARRSSFPFSANLVVSQLTTERRMEWNRVWRNYDVFRILEGYTYSLTQLFPSCRTK